MSAAVNIINFLEEEINTFIFSHQNSTIYDKYKDILQQMEQKILSEKPQINKIRKTLKNLIRTGQLFAEYQQELGLALEELFTNTDKMSDSIDFHDSELGFVRLGVLLREFSKLQQSMLLFASSSLIPLLDSLLATFHDIKHDKSIERACRLAESKLITIKEAANKNESVTIAKGELEYANKLLFCNICEFVIQSLNVSIRRRNVLPLAFCDFSDRNRRMTEEQLGLYAEFDIFMKKTRESCHNLKTHYLTDKERVIRLRDTQAMTIARDHKRMDIYEMEKPKVRDNVACSLSGYLMKKSEGFMKGIAWVKRLCVIRNGKMLIHHGTESKKPVELDLVACEIKISDSDQKNKQFRIFHGGSTRIYLFKAKNVQSLNEWTMVFNNAKSSALDQAFGVDSKKRRIMSSCDENVKFELWRLLQIEANKICADCGDEAHGWISLNLGVFVCLKCCGIHRELGVHVSRTCSITLDDIGTCHLLIPSVLGNEIFNSIYTASLRKVGHSSLIDSSSNMNMRREFITAKYVERRFVTPTHDVATWMRQLKSYIADGSIEGILSLHAEKYQLMVDFDSESSNSLNNSLVFAISSGDFDDSLAIVDFIAQNTKIDLLDAKYSDCESVFHYALINGHIKALQILLKVYPHALEKLDRVKDLLEIANKMRNKNLITLLNAVKYRENHVLNNFMPPIRSVSTSSWVTNHSRGSDRSYTDEVMPGSSLSVIARSVEDSHELEI